MRSDIRNKKINMLYNKVNDYYCNEYLNVRESCKKANISTSVYYKICKELGKKSVNSDTHNKKFYNTKASKSHTSAHKNVNSDVQDGGSKIISNITDSNVVFNDIKEGFKNRDKRSGKNNYRRGLENVDQLNYVQLQDLLIQASMTIDNQDIEIGEISGERDGYKNLFEEVAQDNKFLANKLEKYESDGMKELKTNNIKYLKSKEKLMLK